MSTIEQEPKTEQKLPLDSLEIKGYRCFKELTIPKLARVNLITGKNGVGKSTLLEALWLYAKGGNPQVIDIILRLRHEFGSQASIGLPASLSLRNGQFDRWLLFISSLFFGRSALNEVRGRIQIGPVRHVGDGSQFELRVIWMNESIDKRGNIRRTPINEQPSDVFTAKPYIEIKAPSREPVEFPFDYVNISASPYWISAEPVYSYFFQARGMASSDMEHLWNKVALSELEDQIISALRMIDNRIERISLLSEHDNGEDMIPFVKLTSLPERISLRSLGDGLTRLFFIMLAAVNTANGLLFIDEIENGLHYSVHADLWRTIFDLANRLNVQVFATTHSWECIQAFQEALWSSDENDGELIRLEQKNNTIVPTVFDKRSVKVIAEDWIEVR